MSNLKENESLICKSPELTQLGCKLSGNRKFFNPDLENLGELPELPGNYPQFPLLLSKKSRILEG